MGVLKFVDAVGAAEITGGPYDGVCFYVGGDAYRVWTKPEVDSRAERYRLPVWVRSNPRSVTAAADAAGCLAALAVFGAPKGTLVALDSEMSADAAWTRVFVLAVNAGGHPVIDYGSQSTVFGNDNPDGYYWGADWTDAAHLAAGEGMTQYVSYNNEDLSDALSVLPFWNTRPAKAPVAAKPPVPSPSAEEADMCGPLDLGSGGPAKVLLVPAGKTKLVLHADKFNAALAPTIRVGTFPKWTEQNLTPAWGTPAVLTLPAGTTEVTIARVDTGNVPVTPGWD
jgi:hypothetical protein